MDHQHHAEKVGRTSSPHATHDKHEGHVTSAFLQKFWVVLILTLPILAYSEVVQDVLGWQAPAFAGQNYVILLLGSAVFFYGGWVFIQGAYRELAGRLPGMMTLIALAITAAYAFSAYAVFAKEGETLFWELATLIAIMLLGHYLEMRAVTGAKGALKELSALLPDTAEVLRGKTSETVPLDQLKKHDVVLVRPGGKIPADGVVMKGTSDLDESMVTGESKPVTKEKNDQVIAGTINGDGALEIMVTSIGEGTFLAGVMRLVAQAQASKSRLQMLSDRAAFFLTIIAVVAGTITFAAWFISGAGVSTAVQRMVAVLVITCPHALGLAVPLVASISTTKAAQNGFLVKQRLALEAARDIDIVLFDKTGTLTEGAFGIIDIWSAHGQDAKEVLVLAASLDALSEHPIAKAIVAKAREEERELLNVAEFKALKGKGVTAMVRGKSISAGGAALLADMKIAIPEELKKAVEQAGSKGQTVIFVLKEKVVLGAIALADVVRKESRQAVGALREMGITSAMITGDAEEVARWVSSELGIDEYFARVLPDQKSTKVKELQQRGLKVAMVGDGINDAPALTQADVGIAIGAGTNVAIESAGIILMRNDPRDIARIIGLSRATYRKMLQNLFWATGYNVIALPLAAGVGAPYGIILAPALGALLMSVSTVIVAINAMLLRRMNLP